ncbi:MAG: hypothetical protein AVDCRST_MAG19-4003, partial [uncultured Thermomicrobiales bacterium]
GRQAGGRGAGLRGVAAPPADAAGDERRRPLARAGDGVGGGQRVAGAEAVAEPGQLPAPGRRLRRGPGCRAGAGGAPADGASGRSRRPGGAGQCPAAASRPGPVRAGAAARGPAPGLDPLRPGARRERQRRRQRSIGV